MTTNVASWEDLRLLDVVDAIWRQRDPERVRRIKSLAEGVALLRADDPEGLEAFRARLSAWVDRLLAIGLVPRDLSETHLEAQQRPVRAAAFVARQLVALIVGLPIATAGAVLWAPPFWLVHAVWRLAGVERDTGATVKVLASLLFFPAWWIVVVVAAAVALTPAAAVAIAVAGPAAGLLTRHFFRRRSFALRQLFGVLLVAAKGELAAEARRERDALCVELDALGARVEALRGAPRA
jgi:hypothetical protein